MFIKSVSVANYRLFSERNPFIVEEINPPDFETEGSGMTVFIGENGCGKTALLEAMALPLLSYKADGFSFTDLNNPRNRTKIIVLAQEEFRVDGSMPNNWFMAKGFSFEAGIRLKDSKSYLSSAIVSDQKYLKADGQDKPKDNSPDLRVKVNNPYKGPRFTENDILFLDRNRTFQTRSGTYSSTRFDRLMDDFNFQYLRAISEKAEDINVRLADIKEKAENEFLKSTIEKFELISGLSIDLKFIDNWKPFNKCYFADQMDNRQQVTLDMMGSGYEMIFALLYSFYLSQQSGKQLIVMIDEPDLHLHPSLQERFVDILLEFSQSTQIILTTHSPLMVKYLLGCDRIKIIMLKRKDKIVDAIPVGERCLPFLSSNEVNYLAFGLPTEEYHNELYEELKYLNGVDKHIKEFDIDYFQGEKKQPKKYPWKANPNEVSIHTFVRNQIHHRKENGKASRNDLETSIETMRMYLRESNNP